MNGFRQTDESTSRRINEATQCAALLLALVSGCATPESAQRELSEARRAAAETGGSPVVSAAIVTNTAPALAQGRDSARSLVRLDGPLSLADAIEVGLANNLSLFSTRLRRAEADGAYDEALGEALPALNATAGWTADLVDRSRDVQPDRQSVGLALTQPIFRSGVIGKGIEYARYYRESIELAIRDAEQAAVFQIAALYLNVLYEQRMVEVYEGALGTAERLKSTTESRRRAGSASQYELLRAEVERTSANAALISERNRLRTARVTLLKALGVDQSSQIDLSDDLVYVAEAFDADAMVARALEFRPDLAQAEANVRMAELQLGIVRGRYGLSVDAFASATYATPDPNDVTDDDWGFDASAGLSATLPLYDGTTRRGRLAQARSRLAQAEAARRSAEEDARVAVITAVLDVEDSDELFLSQRTNLATAEEAKRMIESGYRQGRNTQVEVLDAQSALTQAQGAYYSAIRAHSLAGLGVHRATGTLAPADAARYVMPAVAEAADESAP